MIRRVSLECENVPDCRLQFGGIATTFTPLPRNGTSNERTIISQGISTVPLHLKMISTTTATDTTTTESVDKFTTATEYLPTTNSKLTHTNKESLEEKNTDEDSLEENILSHIDETKFADIYNLVSSLIIKCV